MDLLTPTNHAGAYEWAAVYLAHFAIGIAITAIIAAFLDWVADEWIDARGEVALALSIAGYFLIWEGVVQGYGAGFGDAALDTFAFAMGGLVGVLAWYRRGVALAASLAATAGVLWAGVRARK